jgi:hypothetical protein
VTITLWNVTYGQVSLLLPEFGSSPSPLIGRAGNLPSFGVTDTADKFAVNTAANTLVVPLGACYFCTPYIYVAVRADTFTLNTINSTITYNIQFHFGQEIQISNDTYVCHTTSFNANTTYQLTYDWEDMWVVTNWNNNGEQYFKYDFWTSTAALTHTFSSTGPSSVNSITAGSDNCAYVAANAVTTPANNQAAPNYNCAYSQYHITVLTSNPQSPSTYYLHPVVYHWPVNAYTLGSTVSSIGQCGGGNYYYKVATTKNNINMLVIDHTATNLYINYGAVAFSTSDANCPQQGIKDIAAGHTEDFCVIQTGTLYFTVVAPTSDWTATVNVKDPAVTTLALNTPFHDFATPNSYNIYSLTITPTPGQVLTVSATAVNSNNPPAAEGVGIWVMKGDIHGICNTPYSVAPGYAPTVTLPSCDTQAATYYIAVKSGNAGCKVGEYWLTATLGSSVTATALVSGSPVAVANIAAGARNSYYITPGTGSLLSVRLRFATRNSNVDVSINTGSVVGKSTDTCKWNVPSKPCTGVSSWCITEIPPCTFSANTVYGIAVDGTAASGYELTATAVSPAALTNTPVSVTLNQDAAYYTVSQTAVAALGIRLVVSSGKVQVSVQSNNCLKAKTCNDYSQDFRCDSYEGECRLEFASAPTHALQTSYNVKVSGTGSFTIAAYSGTQNTINTLPGGAFCSGIVNYNFWQYKNVTKRDQEANRLYNRWIAKGMWQCPSQACMNALKALACYYMFPAGDANGFLLDPCQSSCVFAQQKCGGNFTWAGFAEFDCTNHLYKPGPTCTGAPPGCDGVPGSGKTYDICGVCGGTGSSCQTSGPTGPSGVTVTTIGVTTSPITTIGVTTIGVTTTPVTVTTGPSSNATTSPTSTSASSNATTTSKTTTGGSTTTPKTSTSTTIGPTTAPLTTTGVSSTVSDAGVVRSPVSVFVALFVILVMFFLEL